MNEIKLYRKRYIPSETVFLKDDVILHRDEEILITKWRVLRPKKKFDHGVSCYFLKRGFKVSKFLNKENELVYYYCDIIDTQWIESESAYIFSDLLADVIVHNNGMVEVVDLDELADGLDENIISQEIVKTALRRLEALLCVIYSGKFQELTQYLEIEE